MTVNFYKYQGTGNDFIMIDNRGQILSSNQRDIIRHLCDRRFGIGADGLIYLQVKSGYDFEMVYFNSDGNESTMCGNGGRCLIQFAHDLGLVSTQCRFIAIDGEHCGEILPDKQVVLKMKDVVGIETHNEDRILNTGSPHYVRFVKDVQQVNVVEEARQIRYSERFKKEGINVNFVQINSQEDLFVRTYERGVEDETFSCGTGVVASAIALASSIDVTIGNVKVQTPGGFLSVKFNKADEVFQDVYLTGPAEKVFEGQVEI